MKEVFRAILLDYEARDPAAAADIQVRQTTRTAAPRSPVRRARSPPRRFPTAPTASSDSRRSSSPPRSPTAWQWRDIRLVNSWIRTSTVQAAHLAILHGRQHDSGLQPSRRHRHRHDHRSRLSGGRHVALQFTSGTLGTTPPTTRSGTTRSYPRRPPTSPSISATLVHRQHHRQPSTPNNFTVSNGTSLRQLHRRKHRDRHLVGLHGGPPGLSEILHRRTRWRRVSMAFTPSPPPPRTNFTVNLASSPANTTGSVF